MWECQPQMRKKVETCRHFLVRQIRVFHAFCHLDPPHPVERGVSYGNTGESADVQLAMGCPPPGKPGITPWRNGVFQVCPILFLHPSDGEPLRQKEDRAGTQSLVGAYAGSKFYSAGQRPRRSLGAYAPSVLV